MSLLYFGTIGLSRESSEPAGLAAMVVGGAGGAFLLAGLWTPVMGVLVALDEIWITLSHRSLPQEHIWIHIYLAVLAVSVAMLGPGAWSIDARLFGRKRFDVDRMRGGRTSP